MKPLPPQETLLKLFYYDPEVGYLIRKKKRAGNRPGIIKGDSVSVEGYGHETHRVIWKMMTGKDPERTIDHHDGNHLNNKWKNLREADNTEQTWNTKRKPGSSGTRGVRIDKKTNKFVVYIGCRRTTYFIGEFITRVEAIIARDKAQKEFHGEFAVSNRP